MATYYVDPSASGADDGTSWTDAWSTLQRAIDGTDGAQPVAGDIVLMRGTETVSVQIDCDGPSGDSTSGVIRFVGVNASGVADGTRYVLDCASNGIHCFAPGANSWISIENVEIKDTGGATKHGVHNIQTSMMRYNWINVYVHDCSGDGWHGNTSTRFRYNNFIRCISESNIGSGFFNIAGVMLACCGSGNEYGVRVLSSQYTLTILSGLFVNNDYGLHLTAYSGHGSVVQNCVIANNTMIGLYWNANAIDPLVVGCRFTGNGTAVNNGGSGASLLACYMPGSGEDQANTTNFSGATTTINELSIDGTNSNTFDGTDVDGGYVGSATGDFNLAANATLRRISVPVDATHFHYISAGITPTDSGGGGASSAAEFQRIRTADRIARGLASL